ncbi:hypothetical protein I7I51_08196, partial [Histoplasma capsulatum]
MISTRTKRQAESIIPLLLHNHRYSDSPCLCLCRCRELELELFVPKSLSVAMAQSNNGIARDCNPRLSTVSDLPASSGAAPPPNNDNHIHNHRTSPLPDTYAALTSAIASFLAVSIHQILYLRAVYPQPTFLPVRHFNHPVRQ